MGSRVNQLALSPTARIALFRRLTMDYLTGDYPTILVAEASQGRSLHLSG